MKKIIAVALALVMIFAFAACKGGNNAESDSPAKAIYTQFKELVKTEKNTADIAQKLSENQDVFADMMMGSIPVSEGALNGFKAEIKGFDEGAMFSPMIGTIPFVGYVFMTKDVDALKTALKENGDLRWNICTQADEMLCEAEGDYVLFIMSPASFASEPDDNTEGGDIELPPEILPDDATPVAPAEGDSAVSE